MSRAVSLLLIAWASLPAGAPAASTDPLPAIAIDVTAPPARSISAYHLFKDVARQIPNAGLVPYDLNTPLFSDYAEKHRFIYVPAGLRVEWGDDGTLDFPVGTVLVKTFSYPRDRRNPGAGARIVETRLLVHRPDGWVGYPYVWNEELSDARLAVAGARVEVAWIHDDGAERATRYIVPNMNECKQCHEKGEVMGPIGPKLGQLDRDFNYAGHVENQLDHWVKAGILAERPEAAPAMPVWDDPATGTLDARARAYLEVNCAHCHNPGGEAASTGLDLSWEQMEPVAYGINKLPTAAGPASRGYQYAIRPAKPHRSFLLSRLRETDPARMMPRTGRTLLHEEGIALIEAWIGAMDPGLGSATHYGTTQ